MISSIAAPFCLVFRVRPSAMFAPSIALPALARHYLEIIGSWQLLFC